MGRVAPDQSNSIAVAYLRMSKLSHLPANLIVPIRVTPLASRPLAFLLAGATAVLAGCAGPQFPGADEQAQSPIASLSLPPYSPREERPPATGDWSGGSPQTGNAPWANRQPGSSWPQADGGEQPSGDGTEAEWLPPPPTFNALPDCERAYGAGQCRTGDEIFRQYAPPGTSVPPQIAYGYMPHAYGSMTGVLVNGYLAPPAAYVVGVPYQSYLFPPVISRYRVITPVVIQRYHTAPVYVREIIIQRGPIVHDHRVRPPYPGQSSVRPGAGAPPHLRPDGPPRSAPPPAPPPAPAPLLQPMTPIAPASIPPGPPPVSPRPGFRPESQPAGPVAPPPRSPGNLPSTPPPPAALRPPLPPPPGTSSTGPQPPSQRPPTATASPPPALRQPVSPPSANPPAGPPAPTRQPPPRDRKRPDDPPGR